MTYYCAHEDDEGVLLVEPIENFLDFKSEEEAVANLAKRFPETVYFEYTKPEVWVYYAMEIDELGVLCVGSWGRSEFPKEEQRVQVAAERNPDVIFFGVKR